ncbi:MAG: sigma-70 family RNA polymerase sigma factor [Planctomycetota bacterium]|nr:MAG: sigma-70 family RNA polymerase sigma factor [Planctomycetota bacterium]
MDRDVTSRDAAAAIAGDARALERLWRSHRRWAAAVALAHKPAGAELEDLLQDIAMTVVRKIGDLRDPASFTPWLRRIVINAARTAGRRRRTRLRLVGAATGGEGALDRHADGDAGDRPEALAEGRRLLDLAQRLHPDYREPLLLRCVRGMSHKQISGLLDLPVTTIETRIARARKMLREEVEFEAEARSLPVTRAVRSD